LSIADKHLILFFKGFGCGALVSFLRQDIQLNWQMLTKALLPRIENISPKL